MKKFVSTLAPLLFSMNLEAQKKDEIQKLDDYILSNTYIGSEIQKIDKVAKIRKNNVSYSLNSSVEYDQITNSINFNPFIFEEQTLDEYKLNPQDSKLLSFSHEKIHNIQDMSSVFNCYEEAVKISENKKNLEIPLEVLPQIGSCINFYLNGNKIDPNSQKAVLETLEILSDTYLQNLDEIIFVRELQAYAFHDANFGNENFENFFFAHYPQFSDFKNKYNQTLENVKLLYGNVDVIGASQITGSSTFSIDTFNNTVSQKFGSLKEESILRFEKRKNKLKEDYRLVINYAQ